MHWKRSSVKKESANEAATNRRDHASSLSLFKKGAVGSGDPGVAASTKKKEEGRERPAFLLRGNRK